MIPINTVIEILKQAMDFSNNIVSKFDDEKYARAVMEIYGKEPDYYELEKLADAICNATDISTKDKADILFALADKRSEIRKKEIELRKECGEIANEGFEKKCKIALWLVMGVATGGLSLIPGAYHSFDNKSHYNFLSGLDSRKNKEHDL